MAKLQVYEKQMTDKVAEALQKAGGEITRVSVKKTPLATGEQRSRSFNEGPLKEGKDVYVQVVGNEKFGDSWEREGNAYAVPLHENLAAQHSVGEAKFLEHALQETEHELLGYLGKERKI